MGQFAILESLLFPKRLLQLRDSLCRLLIHKLGRLDTIHLHSLCPSYFKLSAEQTVFRTDGNAIITALVCRKPAQLFFQHAMAAEAEHIGNCLVMNRAVPVRENSRHILGIVREIDIKLLILVRGQMIVIEGAVYLQRLKGKLLKHFRRIARILNCAMKGSFLLKSQRLHSCRERRCLFSASGKHLPYSFCTS